MTDEQTTQTEQKPPVEMPDPVIDFFASLHFDHDVFDELHVVSCDPEKYDRYFKVPELFVLLNAHYVLNSNDPNRGNADHEAIQNMLRWIAIKCASDPVWMCYFGDRKSVV